MTTPHTNEKSVDQSTHPHNQNASTGILESRKSGKTLMTTPNPTKATTTPTTADEALSLLAAELAMVNAKTARVQEILERMAKTSREKRLQRELPLAESTTV